VGSAGDQARAQEGERTPKRRAARCPMMRDPCGQRNDGAVLLVFGIGASHLYSHEGIRTIARTRWSNSTASYSDEGSRRREFELNFRSTRKRPMSGGLMKLNPGQRRLRHIGLAHRGISIPAPNRLSHSPNLIYLADSKLIRNFRGDI